MRMRNDEVLVIEGQEGGGPWSDLVPRSFTCHAEAEDAVVRLLNDMDVDEEQAWRLADEVLRGAEVEVDGQGTAGARLRLVVASFTWPHLDCSPRCRRASKGGLAHWLGHDHTGTRIANVLQQNGYVLPEHVFSFLEDGSLSCARGVGELGLARIEERLEALGFPLLEQASSKVGEAVALLRRVADDHPGLGEDPALVAAVKALEAHRDALTELAHGDLADDAAQAFRCPRRPLADTPFARIGRRRSWRRKVSPPGGGASFYPRA
jgi:hypothetical protein